MARPCWVCHLQVSQLVAPYTLTLGGQTLNVDLGPSALSLPDVERLIGERLYADQSSMWAALTTAAEALGENVKLASPYELNWNHTIDVTAGIDAIPESDHLSESNIYLKPVTLFADTVQNRVQAVVLGGLEVTGSLWEKLLGFSSTQSGNNSQAVMTAASVARVDRHSAPPRAHAMEVTPTGASHRVASRARSPVRHAAHVGGRGADPKAAPPGGTVVPHRVLRLAFLSTGGYTQLSQSAVHTRLVDQSSPCMLLLYS
jgi:hypothetical protein